MEAEKKVIKVEERGFQRPKYLECDYETLTETYGRFSAQPFERGYGITVGNALRRILLSSITGAAITAIRIQGVLHEFSTLPGIVEDVTDIILNLKSIPLKLEGKESRTMTLRKEGPAEALASDIEHDSDVKILDSDIHIASLDKDGKLDIEMVVKNNRGYISADQNYDQELSVDFIPLDSSHSPIKRVNYRVESARVGKRIDYENLSLEVWTSGAITPQDALAQAAKIMRDHLVIFLTVVDEPVQKEHMPAKKEIPYMSQAEILSKSIEHLELSVRSNNCLKAAGIEKIFELVKKTEDELLKTKNFGRKSLTEIKETLANLGLGLNLELHPKLLEMVEGEKKEREEEEEEQE
jgi:DNA-directed RNA polymerase subunit alpha